MPWSETKKATIFKAMTAQYTSSDESDLSEDENGVMQLKGYRVRKLPWERSALTTVKKSLDEAYLKTLHPRPTYLRGVRIPGLPPEVAQLIR